MTPSPYRVLLVLGGLLLLATGIASGATAVTALAGGLLVVLARAPGTARARLALLAVSREVYPSAFEDDVVSVDLLLENRSARPARLVLVEDGFGPAVADRQVLLEAGPLPPHRRRRLRYRTACSRRWGIHPVGPLVLAVSDPLGLSPAARAFPPVEAFAVFPRVVEVPGLAAPGGLLSLAPHDSTSARAGQGALFLGVRDYRAGDDPRRIHWPATARRGITAVKEYERDLVPFFTLVLDLHAAQRAGTGAKSTLEYLVRTAASLLWSATRQGHYLQLIAEGGPPLSVNPGQGELHLTHLLFELLRARQDGRVALCPLVAEHATDLPHGSAAVLLSASCDLSPAELGEALDLLAARAVRTLVLLVDRDSFVPVARWPLPRPQAQARNAALLASLHARGVGAAILGAEDDLAAALARPGLLDTR